MGHTSQVDKLFFCRLIQNVVKVCVDILINAVTHVHCLVFRDVCFATLFLAKVV